MNITEELLCKNGVRESEQYDESLNQKISDSKTFEEKNKNIKKKSQVKGFLLKEEAQKLYRKADRIDKKTPKNEEDEETIRQLRDEAQRINQEAQRLHNIADGIRLGEKILYGFCGAQVLIAAVGSLSKSPFYYGMSKPVQELIVTEQEVNPLEARAIAIEHLIESFQNINESAIEHGLIDIDRPLLDSVDRERLQRLANIMRDPNGTPEQYASICQELGLDGKDAYKFYETEKTVALGMKKANSTPIIDRQTKEIIETGMELA